MAARRALLLIPVLSACAASPEVPTPETGGAAVSPAGPTPPVSTPEPAPPPVIEADPVSAPPPRTPLQQALDLLAEGREAAGLAALREELATGAQHRRAAQALAAYLVPRERLDEALASFEAGLQREPGQPELMMARAVLLRDMGERERALQAMRECVAQGETDPRLWLQIVELEWLRGGRDAALQALAELDSRYGDHPWLAENRAGIRELEQEINDHTEPQTISRRDLLGDLRGAENGMRRFTALRMLSAEGGTLQRRATKIGLSDTDPSLRVQAMRLGEWTVAESEVLSRGALVDAAPSVRAEALQLCRRIDPRIAGPMVFEALQRETDPDTFRLMHDALQELRGVRVFLPPGAADDDAGRQGMIERWREIIGEELPWSP